jgi:Zn finger protein HypA/HybF involved in hydrogenase expression
MNNGRTKCLGCGHVEKADAPHAPKRSECPHCEKTVTHVWLGPDHKEPSDA